MCILIIEFIFILVEWLSNSFSFRGSYFMSSAMAKNVYPLLKRLSQSHIHTLNKVDAMELAEISCCCEIPQWLPKRDQILYLLMFDNPSMNQPT